MIEGKHANLVAIEREHLPILAEWRNREDFRCFFREYRELSLDNQDKWYESLQNNPNVIMFSILGAQAGDLIGCCGLTNIHWIYRRAELSLYIGRQALYLDNKYAPDAMRLLIGYAFGELGLHRLWIEAYETDAKRIELCKNIGMCLEGTLRQNVYKGGKWHDSRIYSLLVGECGYGK